MTTIGKKLKTKLSMQKPADFTFSSFITDPAVIIPDIAADLTPKPSKEVSHPKQPSDR
jgi:hypothetical protein